MSKLVKTGFLATGLKCSPFSKIAPVKPQVIGLDVTCGYSETIPESAGNTVEDKIKDNLSDTACSRTAGCAVSVSLDNAVGGVSMAKINFQAALSSSGNLDIDGYMSTGISKQY